MAKVNCWEFKSCGRQPGGRRVADSGVCPAAEEMRLNGVHDGSNAGRSCWIIAQTLCRGEVQGTFARKFKDCTVCDFYQTVKKEEFPHFQLSAALVKIVTE